MEPHWNWFSSKYDDVGGLLVSISNSLTVWLKEQNKECRIATAQYAWLCPIAKVCHKQLTTSPSLWKQDIPLRWCSTPTNSSRLRFSKSKNRSASASNSAVWQSTPHEQFTVSPRGREAIRQGRGGKPCVFQLHTHRSATTTGSQPTFLCVDPPSDQAPPGSLSFLVVLYIYCIDDRMSRYILPTFITER